MGLLRLPVMQGSLRSPSGGDRIRFACLHGGAGFAGLGGGGNEAGLASLASAAVPVLASLASVVGLASLASPSKMHGSLRLPLRSQLASLAWLVELA